MGFRDLDLERRYQLCRSRGLRRNDLQLLKYAFVMNAVFNCIILITQKAVPAGLLYCATLLAHTAALKLLQRDQYVVYRNALVSCWRLSWHVSCAMGLQTWSEPYNDSPACFLKLMTFLSGVVALNWVHALTVLSSGKLDVAMQAVAALGYMLGYTPRHVCPLLLQHATHVALLRRVWGVMDAAMQNLAQLLPLPMYMISPGTCSSSSSVGNSSSSSSTAWLDLVPMACRSGDPADSSNRSSSVCVGLAGNSSAGHSVELMCLQSTIFLQVMVGIVVPCLSACWSDFAARRHFLCTRWQQYEQLQQQQQQQQQQRDGSSSSGSTTTTAAEVEGTFQSCAESDGGNLPQKQLLDHPLEWVFHWPSVSVGLLLLSFGVWLLLGEICIVLPGQLRAQLRGRCLQFCGY